MYTFSFKLYLTYGSLSFLDEYIDEVKFCFNGVGATWTEGCECGEGDFLDFINKISFVAEPVEDEQIVQVTCDSDGTSAPTGDTTLRLAS